MLRHVLKVVKKKAAVVCNKHQNAEPHFLHLFRNIKSFLSSIFLTFSGLNKNLESPETSRGQVEQLTVPEIQEITK